MASLSFVIVKEAPLTPEYFRGVNVLVPTDNVDTVIWCYICVGVGDDIQCFSVGGDERSAEIKRLLM